MKRFAFMSAAAILLAAPALAQYGPTKGVSARAGFFFPSNGAARNEGRTFFALGLDYRLGYLGDKKVADRSLSASYSISLDWYGKGDHQAIPVLFNYTGRQEQIYYSVGAGLGQLRKPEPNAGTDTQTRFMFQLSAGYDLAMKGQAYFVEGRYWGSSSASHSGFGFYGGIRF